ncbi:N-acetyltransferase domain-containing protein [Cupriavidus necator]|uniref:GNAT family N-acetyltransferase n=1 Tax=Cupriavidus necator TaxID=106590 RepID=UPI003F73252B
MIRTATLEDLPEVLALGEMLHAESPRWSRLSFNRTKVLALMQHLVESPDGLLLVAESKGEVLGGIAALSFSHWSSDDLVAEEISFFLHPKIRGSFAATRLICAMQAWARIRGAKSLIVGASTGISTEDTARLYERLGFRRCAIGLEVTFQP